MAAEFCKRGHPRSPENLRPNGTCRVCAREQSRERYQRLSAEAGVQRRVHDPDRFPCGHPRSPENTKPNGRQCRECHRAGAHRRYWADPDAHRREASEYQRRNRAAADERQAAWRARNIERYRAYNRKASLIRRLGVREDPETREYLALIAADPCAYCGGPSQAVDHIVPVSRGGPNHWSNFTAACHRCNGEKYNKPLLRFLADRQAA